MAKSLEVEPYTQVHWRKYDHFRHYINYIRLKQPQMNTLPPTNLRSTCVVDYSVGDGLRRMGKAISWRSLRRVRPIQLPGPSHWRHLLLCANTRHQSTHWRRSCTFQGTLALEHLPTRRSSMAEGRERMAKEGEGPVHERVG